MNQNEGKVIKTETVKSISEEFYAKITEEGIEAIKSLFSKGKTLSEELKYDSSEEYLKKMIIAQLDIGKMLLTHRFYNASLSTIPEFRKESDALRKKANEEDDLQFDDETIEELFGNTLGISSDTDYESWKDFVYGEGQSKIDNIFLEEEFNHNYEREKNPIKKFIQSFKYRKTKKQNSLEDSYSKIVRKIIKEGIAQNPDNIFIALRDCHNTIEKGIAEYEGLHEIEDIVRMTLMSLTVNQGQAIDIEAESKRLREELKNNVGTRKTRDEFRQKQVTLGSTSTIRKRPVIQTIPFEEIPKAIQKLQAEYEKVYNTDQSQEDYIRQIARLYTDFIYLQPYEDGNKRTGMCLFNSMLLSKGIVPPPISLINDEQMVIAYNKVHDENDYSMLQDIIIEKYRRMQPPSENNEGHKREGLEDYIEK